MTVTPRILIAEDNPTVVEALRSAIKTRWPQAYIAPATTPAQAQQLSAQHQWDVILLDYSAPQGNFHIINIESQPERIIAISSLPEANQLAQQRGVQHIVPKPYTKLDDFAQAVVSEIASIL